MIMQIFNTAKISDSGQPIRQMVIQSHISDIKLSQMLNDHGASQDLSLVIKQLPDFMLDNIFNMTHHVAVFTLKESARVCEVCGESD
jgi:hypothetical protein